MKRFISLLSLAMILAGNLVLSANAATTYTGVSHSNAYADAAIYASAAGTTYEKTSDAADTGTNDVIFGQTSGEMLYMGFAEKFDGVSIDIGTSASGGAYVLEYWNGSSWATLIGSSSATVQNTSGYLGLEWTRPSDWAKTTVNMSLTEDGSFNEMSSSLYFVRTRITSNYSARAYADQIGVLDYNAIFDVENQLGQSVSMDSSSVSFSSSAADNTVYASKSMSSTEYAYALYTPSTASYNYTLNVSGYVQESGSANFSEATTTVSETLNFAQVVKAYDNHGSQITISSISAGAYSCTISNKVAYCPISAANDSMNVTVYASAYDASTITLYNRSSDSEAQAVNTVYMNSTDDEGIDLDVESMEWQDDGDFVVTLQNEGDEDVDEDEKVYVAVYVDGDREYYDYYENDSSSSFLNAGKSQTLNFGDDFLDDDEDSYDVEVCVDATDTVDEDDESNNCYEKTLRQDDDDEGVDLEVDDLYMDDDDLIVKVINSGDEDVSSSKTVKLYVYVDGDLEYTLSIDDHDDEGDFFEAG